jgi:putative transposase
MNDDESNTPQDVALWRYGIMSRLLHRDPEGLAQEELLAELTGQDWVRPDGERCTLSPETLRKWLYRYRVGGLDALADQPRADKGRFQLPEALADALFALRAEHPRWRLSILFKHVRHTGLWDGLKPSRSALYRFCQNKNLGRAPLPPSPRRAFAFTAFGQLWSADFLHGPKLWVGKRKAKVYLHAILDDCSRFVVGAAFHTAESVESMMADLMGAVRRFGIPQRYYSDNGAAYRSRHLQVVAARLGIQIPHTPPYQPQGRGKIERFFGTVRGQFLEVQHFKTLEEINQAFAQWLAEYHHTLHSALKATPLDRRLGVENVCREVPAVADVEPLFRMERRCRVSGCGSIRLMKREFEVPGCLPLSRTTAYYLPWDLSRVFYGDDMLLARPLDRAGNARRFEHPAAQAHPKERHED